MTENKVNMSLDDIIKSERRNKNANRPMRKQRVIRNKRGRVTRQARGGRRENIKLNAATMKAVNRLVKKAISQRMNQRIIRRAAPRRILATRGIMATRPAGFRARRSFNFARSSLPNRFRGVNQRSRVIISGSARRAQQAEPLVLSTNVKKVRGRGTARLGQLVSDEAPVFLEREILPVDEEVVEEIPRVQFPRRRQVVLQQRRRPVVVQRRVATRPVVTYVPVRRNRGIRKRNVQAQFTRSVRPVYERVQTGKRVFVNPSAVQMREALGIGRRADRIVERFEPSSSFLQRLPATKQKGRGFLNRY